MVRRTATAVCAIAGLVVTLCWAVPPAAASGSLAVGDSITVGAQSQLQGAGYRVDAAVGRTLSQGLQIMRGLGTALPAQLIVNLGTNGGVALGQCQELLSIVGPDRSLTLVTINLPSYPGVAASSNEALARCAANPNVRLLDWAGYTKGQPAVLCPDGIHISCGGANAYAEFVLSGAAGQPTQTAALPQGAVSSSPTVGVAGTRQEAESRAAAAAAEAAQQEAAAAQAAAIAAEKQRILTRLQRVGVVDPAVVDREASPGNYRFVPVVERMLKSAANS